MTHNKRNAILDGRGEPIMNAYLNAIEKTSRREHLSQREKTIVAFVHLKEAALALRPDKPPTKMPLP